MISFQHILVPVDFGAASKHALDVAIDLATQYRGTLTLLHTWEIPFYAYGGMELGALDELTPFLDAAEAELASALATARKTIPGSTALLKRGVVWREILELIEARHPDLVVMGTHGRKGVGRVLLGSVAEKIVRMSPAPVLTVGTPLARLVVESTP